ncbi:MAG: hypothetical protein KJO07_19090, partial [Deltaproteobacteria bacterium]|nr:hypothetical protein [Deltaproteobacteria bacterium]
MSARWVSAVSLLAVFGCSQSDFGGFPTPGELPEAPEGPGHPAWGDTDISCISQSDCAPSESCENNVCMPARCGDGPYDSSSPIGPVYLFFEDKEILAADSNLVDGGYWVDGYLPSSSDITYRSGGSWNMGGGAILDVAGGNVLGQRPDGAVAVVAGSATIQVRHDNGDSSLSIGFQPIAVAAGDIDQDSVDEIVALGSSGKYAICDAAEGACESYTVEGATEGYDVTIGDVDGDNFKEPVFHVKKNGDEHIVALNYDYEETGEPKWIGGPSDGYLAISAGTVDDNADKVIALRDGGGFGWIDDKLDTLQLSETSVSKLGTASVSSEARDVELDDMDMDGRDEIALLQGEAEVQLRRPVSASTHTIMVTKTLSVTDAPLRLGLADLDGDSPSARQVGGPELVPGGITPIMALQFPPFSQTFSDASSYLFIGQTENISEDFSDSMSVRYGVGVGFEAKIKGVVRAGFMARFGREFSKRRTLGKRYTIGSRFSISPD